MDWRPDVKITVLAEFLPLGSPRGGPPCLPQLLWLQAALGLWSHHPTCASVFVCLYPISCFP